MRESNPHEAELEIDHYKLWNLDRFPFDRTVHTRGQFDRERRPCTTIGLDFIGNPVAKDGVAAQFPERHLTGYSIHPPTPSVPEPRRRVVFSNQFGPRHEWKIGDPTLLLLPAGKSFPDRNPTKPEQPNTHYLCYQVERGDALDRTVQLQDQFDDVIGHPELEGPLFPAFFAVPVEKNDEPIGNAKVHLAIYRFQAREPFDASIFIRIFDQFIQDPPILFHVAGPAMLAVPSIKLEWNEEQ